MSRVQSKAMERAREQLRDAILAWGDASPGDEAQDAWDELERRIERIVKLARKELP